MMIMMWFDLESCYFDVLNFEKLHSAKAYDLAGRIWQYLKYIVILNSEVALVLVIFEVFVRIELHEVNYRGRKI